MGAHLAGMPRALVGESPENNGEAGVEMAPGWKHKRRNFSRERR